MSAIPVLLILLFLVLVAAILAAAGRNAKPSLYAAMIFAFIIFIGSIFR